MNTGRTAKSIALLTLATWIATVQRGCAKPATDGPASPKSLPSVSLRLEKHEVLVGEGVKLRELIPRGQESLLLFGPEHTVLRLAFFHFGRDRFVYLTDRNEMNLLGEWELCLDGLPQLTLASHGWGYDLKTRNFCGIEFHLRPKRSGVYLVSAQWNMLEVEHDLQSNPVLLIVRPQRDEQGRPIVDEAAKQGPAQEDQQHLEHRFDSGEIAWDA